MDKERLIAAVLLAIMLVAFIRGANSEKYGPEAYPDFWRAFGFVPNQCTCPCGGNK